MSNPSLSTHPDSVYAPGLAGVVAGETALSWVRGAEGALTIAGRSVETLAQQCTYEEVVAALLGADGEAVNLAQGRVRAFEVVDLDLVRRSGIMAALRAALASLPTEDIDESVLIASVGLALAAHQRWRSGAAPIAPDPSLGHAQDILRMAGLGHGSAASSALDNYLVAVVDHGFNASTFTARVVASTRAPAAGALIAAMAALEGPLHGGAPGPVLDMLEAIGTPEAARPWLENELAHGRRIMGMGHRVYRVRDPRAAVLERALTELIKTGEIATSGDLLRLARRVEEEAEALLAARYPTRTLKANVEFYTATLLTALGFDRSVFSGVFAASRAAGWCAHVAEERAVGRLIRPRARYVGASERATRLR